MNKASSLVSPSRLAIAYRPLGELIPDPRNARTHHKRQIDQIRASIEAFGFTNPVLADPEGHIIAGHGRLQAARLMGLAELPVITLSGLSETQKRTLRIADNKIALNAGWDLEILQLELGELGSIDVDTRLFRSPSSSTSKIPRAPRKPSVISKAAG
jgi:ParB-like chromosome segregation protein Spo0J